MRKTRLFLLTVAAIAGLTIACNIPIFSAEEDFTTSGNSDIPIPMAASDAGDRAIAKMSTAPGLKIELFAAEPMFANPVALNFDNQGRCYVIETWRQHGVIDIRGHMDWLDDDLACKTVEDRMKMIRRKMGPNARSFARYPDVIRLLEDDSEPAGRQKHGICRVQRIPTRAWPPASCCRKNDVYVTNIPNLWLLQDTNGDGKPTSARASATATAFATTSWATTCTGRGSGPTENSTSPSATVPPTSNQSVDRTPGQEPRFRQRLSLRSRRLAPGDLRDRPAQPAVPGVRRLRQPLHRRQ